LLSKRISALELKLWKQEHPPKFKRGDRVLVTISVPFSPYSYNYKGTIVQMQEEKVDYRDYLVMPDEPKRQAENVHEYDITMEAKHTPNY